MKFLINPYSYAFLEEVIKLDKENGFVYVHQIDSVSIRWAFHYFKLFNENGLLKKVKLVNIDKKVKSYKVTDKAISIYTYLKEIKEVIGVES